MPQKPSPVSFHNFYVGFTDRSENESENVNKGPEMKSITVSFGFFCCLLTFRVGVLSHVRFPILSFLYSLYWSVVFCFLFSMAVVVGHSFCVFSPFVCWKVSLLFYILYGCSLLLHFFS